MNNRGVTVARTQTTGTGSPLGRPNMDRSFYVTPADIILLAHSSDHAAVRTLREAIKREGWNVAAEGESATCAIVVWSQKSVTNAELARAARPYLDCRRILQILWQPEGWRYGKSSQVEAPEPFRYYQSLQVPYQDLDGSERAMDWFEFSAGEGERILAEVARLGDLHRPCDDWNAKITFYKPFPRWRRSKVVLVECAKDGGRVLRRRSVDQYDPDWEDFETTLGNRWSVIDVKTGKVVQLLEVEEEETGVRLPKRKPWWGGILGG
jgi:hypothetical protein